MPSHSHNVSSGNDAGSSHLRGGDSLSGTAVVNYNTANTGGGGSHSHNMSANFTGSAVTPTGNFSGSTTSVIQPYLALKFMIKT